MFALAFALLLQAETGRLELNVVEKSEARRLPAPKVSIDSGVFGLWKEA